MATRSNNRGRRRSTSDSQQEEKKSRNYSSIVLMGIAFVNAVRKHGENFFMDVSFLAGDDQEGNRKKAYVSAWVPKHLRPLAEAMINGEWEDDNGHQRTPIDGVMANVTVTGVSWEPYEGKSDQLGVNVSGFLDYLTFGGQRPSNGNGNGNGRSRSGS